MLDKLINSSICVIPVLMDPKQMNEQLGSESVAISKPKGMVPLKIDYQPGEHDVICARGKQAKNHSGNVWYRELIDESLEQYDAAATKTEKTVLVTSILEAVRNASPDGGFIKKVEGRWMEVGDHIAREKIGQSLRDRLHTKYSSSTQAKRRRRHLLESGPFFPRSIPEANREALALMRHQEEQKQLSDTDQETGESNSSKRPRF